MDQLSILVPSSTANVGPGYDIWCIGLRQPRLRLTYTRRPQPGIEFDAKSLYTPSGNTKLGYAGKLALEQFLKEHSINEGAHLSYEDEDEVYPVGGLGRSGAEAVGAIMSAATIYEKKLSRNDIVIHSAKAEPNEHKDNVAASTNGRFNIIIESPYRDKPFVDSYDVPNDLGIAIGFSSWIKPSTAAGRKVLRDPVNSDDFVKQTGVVSGVTAALVSGNIDRYLELVRGDRFHEPRRARVRFYGNFDDDALFELKRRLFNDFHVAWIVSGAGPNMTALYNKKEYPTGVSDAISPFVVPWFMERDVKLNLKEREIAKEGAYDYARKEFNF